MTFLEFLREYQSILAPALCLVAFLIGYLTSG